MVVAPLAIVLGSVACNNIIGLTDFEKVECPGRRCADGGLPDQFVPDSPVTETGADGGLDAKGTPPTVWARWQMPNYGEGGAGEPPNPLKYTVSGDLIADDTTKKLKWHIATADVVDFAGATAKCAGLANGPWRVPKRIELITLLDYGRESPFVDARFGIKNDKVWSSSEVRAVDLGDGGISLTGKYWIVDFDTGTVKPQEGTLNARVLCVLAQ